MKKIKYVIVLCVLMLITLPCVVANAAETKKAIHIVYDDTSGIYRSDNGEFSDKWSQLKNAVANFVALSNTGDKIVIYPISMNGEGIELENTGNPAELISAVDNKLNGYALGRRFSVVTSAWEDLKEESGSYEKWLILICDGKFEEYKDENSDSSIQEKLVSYASGGIKVVSQAISNDGAIYNLKNDENFYCYNVGGTNEILQKTLEISNLIYGRKMLTEDFYEYDQKAGTLTFKDTGLPIKKMIVMVNNENGTVSGKPGDASASTVSIREPQKAPDIFAGQKKDLKYAPDLDRNIYIYEYSEPLQPGEYKINITNGSNVSIIYKADVKVELRLYRNGSTMDGYKSISTGKYDYRIVAVNPITGREINSPMFDGAVYSIKSENGTNVTNLDKKEGEISFLKGNTRVETVIDLGSQKFMASTGFYVFGDADFIVGSMEKYNVKELESGKPFKVIVSTESLPENVELYCSSNKDIKFRVEKTGNAHEFLVYPEHINPKSYLFTATGNIDVVFTVVINESGEVLTYSKPGVVTVNDVSVLIRCGDWLWYYKWYLIGAVVLVVAFVVMFNMREKKKNIVAVSVETEETSEEAIENDTEDI